MVCCPETHHHGQVCLNADGTTDANKLRGGQRGPSRLTACRMAWWWVGRCSDGWRAEPCSHRRCRRHRRRSRFGVVKRSAAGVGGGGEEDFGSDGRTRLLSIGSAQRTESVYNKRRDTCRQSTRCFTRGLVRHCRREFSSASLCRLLPLASAGVAHQLVCTRYLDPLRRIRPRLGVGDRMTQVDGPRG